MKAMTTIMKRNNNSLSLKAGKYLRLWRYFPVVLALSVMPFSAGAQEAPSPEASPQPLPSPVIKNTSPSIQNPLFSLAQSNFQLTNPFNSPFNQQNFVPNTSLILDASYAWRSLDNETFQGLRAPSKLRGLADHSHRLNLNNGFNLNYAELTLAAPVDPYFDMFSTFHLSRFAFEIEEAYINTRGLPGNLRLKMGQFLSDIGRQNNQHAHFWSFAEAPLIYNTFFGGESLNELGIQMNWLAPTDFYLNLGTEILKGTNVESFGTSSFAIGEIKQPEVNLPNLFTLYAKTSFDIEDIVVLGGLSYIRGGTRLPPLEAVSTEAGHEGHFHAAQTQPNSYPTGLDNFAGGTQILGADLTLRYLINSYQDISWQSEFMQRWVSGTQYSTEDPIALSRSQNGMYSQLTWRFHQQWRTGARIDMLMQNQTTQENNTLNHPGFLPRYSAMVEYNPSEFSRFRLQYTHDRSLYQNQQASPYHELSLQLNLSMGAHGAHNF